MTWRLIFTTVVCIFFSPPTVSYLQEESIYTKEFDNALSSVAFDLQGQRLIIGGLDSVIWDFAGSGETIYLVTQGNLRDVVVDPSGNILASANSRGDIQVWNMFTGELIETLHCEPYLEIYEPDHYAFCYSATSVAWSPTDSILASAHADGYVRLWDTGSMTLITELKHEDIVRSVAFSPDGAIVAAATGTVPFHGEEVVNSIQLWDVQTGLQVLDIRDVAGAVYTVAFSPDGNTLASGGYDRMITIWDIETGEAIVQITGHEESVSSIEFSLDGEYLVSGGYDNTVRVWKVDTWEELATYTEHSRFVTDVAFSPDGLLIASVSADATAIVRPLELVQTD